MLTAIIKALLGAIFPSLFGSKDPTEVDLADSNARAQERLNQEVSANEALAKAVAARTDAAAGSLSGINGPASDVNLDPDAPVNRSEHAHFRD